MHVFNIEIPTPLWAQSSKDIGSSIGLANAPTVVAGSSSSRSFLGTSVRLTNAGGQMYNFPTSGASSAAELQLMVGHWSI